MTTSDTLATAQKPTPRFRLPDIPEKHPDDMTTSKHLAQNGNMYNLSQHLGKQETTIVSGERYICRAPGSAMRYPDLLVAFNADTALFEYHNGYIISEQGKPPDFVLEIASRRTGATDTGVKRDYYESLEIAEYWRFDETGEYHGARLAGDILSDGRFRPTKIEALAGDASMGGALRGHSVALGLYLHWEAGQLAFYDPATGAPIASLETERERADRAEARIHRLEALLRAQNPSE
ncbi:MAG: Uma2 family endonuclease [Chloroflexi bacterium]|nr:Uma2 family endonuclease [Chloroflexota bacterium]